MSILSRYLGREALAGSIAAALVLTFLGLTGRLVRYLEEAANGTLAPELVFAIVAGRVPGVLQIVLPLALFLGVLLMVGRLYADQEAAALRAAGFGRRHLARTLAFPVFIVFAATLGLSLYVSPKTAEWVQRQVETGRQVAGIAGLSPQQFQSIGDQAVFYASDALDDGRMEDVFVYQSGPLDTVFKAEFAFQQQDSESGQRFLVLQQGQRWRGDVQRLDWERLDFKEYMVRLELPDLRQGPLKVEALQTEDLLAGGNREQAQLHWRIALALMVPIGALLAMAMGPVAPRSGRWTKFLPGVLLFIVYFGLVNYVHSQMIDGKLPMLAGIWPVHLFMFCVAQGLSWQNRRRGLA